jgi:hypothetical protein
MLGYNEPWALCYLMVIVRARVLFVEINVEVICLSIRLVKLRLADERRFWFERDVTLK